MRGAPRNAHRGAPSIWLLRVLVFVVTYPEGEDRRRVEGLSCIQDRGGEVRLVRRVREVLRLERVPRGLPVRVAADADQVTVEEVAGVELNPRLVCPHGQLTP